ncbi:hypothetical protein DVA86_27300 [Streptomyces armeniacus]|uniref:Uncharacterized protein n=1 Tax=Streptomyces armeniacus TaxID=83291 RepID=A0A345XVX1_9ACTN|nr:hypothetical protein [Streptomyces armeniacus]AXK35787.1 hypothetical protein DVA86_27300 [Streptomyces armeniacus]
MECESPECSGTCFEIMSAAFLTIDLGDESDANTLTIDGIGEEYISLVCAECKDPQRDIRQDIAKAFQRLLVRHHREHGYLLPLGDVHFADGTVVSGTEDPE